jgi:hypothetical protein
MQLRSFVLPPDSLYIRLDRSDRNCSCPNVVWPIQLARAIVRRWRRLRTTNESAIIRCGAGGGATTTTRTTAAAVSSNETNRLQCVPGRSLSSFHFQENGFIVRDQTCFVGFHNQRNLSWQRGVSLVAARKFESVLLDRDGLSPGIHEAYICDSVLLSEAIYVLFGSIIFFIKTSL